jgi:hypothetical protein
MCSFSNEGSSFTKKSNVKLYAGPFSVFTALFVGFMGVWGCHQGFWFIGIVVRLRSQCLPEASHKTKIRKPWNYRFELTVTGWNQIRKKPETTLCSFEINLVNSSSVGFLTKLHCPFAFFLAGQRSWLPTFQLCSIQNSFLLNKISIGGPTWHHNAKGTMSKWIDKYCWINQSKNCINRNKKEESLSSGFLKNVSSHLL